VDTKSAHTITVHFEQEKSANMPRMSQASQTVHNNCKYHIYQTTVKDEMFAYI